MIEIINCKAVYNKGRADEIITYNHRIDILDSIGLDLCPIDNGRPTGYVQLIIELKHTSFISVKFATEEDAMDLYNDLKLCLQNKYDTIETFDLNNYKQI